MMIYGILGDERIFRSKSPVMHNAVLRRRGLRGTYVPFAVQPDRIDEAVRGIRALGIAGVNVTIPHKEAVAPLMDQLSQEASTLGAVNTIVCKEGALHGHNTDIGGFTDALAQAGFRTSDARALVFGSGGAAKAILLALRNLNAKKIFVTSRNFQRTTSVAGHLSAEAVPIDHVIEVSKAVDLLINATSVSSPDESPQFAQIVESLRLSVCSFIMDINYGREKNFWKLLAHVNGLPFMDGIPMLVHQARRSFELWTGVKADADEFKKALKEGK